MLFIDNKYTRIYFSIIDQANTKVRPDYTENHHIIPRSLGGTDDADNLVSLTAKEHYLCHLLLPKMLEGENKYKMLCAIHRMAFSNQKQRVKVPSRVYERVRQEKAAMHSKLFSGKRNPFYGKTHSPEVIEKIKEARARQVEKQGSVMTEEARRKLREKLTCPHCGKTGGKSIMKRWHMDNCKYK